MRTAATRLAHGGHGAAVLSLANVADPGQRPADAVTAPHGFGLELHRLDTGQRLHGIRQGRATKGTAQHVVLQPASRQGRITGLFQIHAADIVGPGQKTRGTARAADGAHGIQSQGKAPATGIQRRGKGPGTSQLTHQGLGIEMLLIDAVGRTGQRSLGNALDLLHHLRIRPAPVKTRAARCCRL